MKKLFPFVSTASRAIRYVSPLDCCGVLATVLLVGCTAVVTRWDAGKIRQEVMAYYNDEIMENLIRMKEHLPFVHVDITTVNAQVLSQVSGTVGGGETTSSTRTTRSVAAALGTVSRMITDPFSFSVTPTHSDTLTMTGAPVIGQLTSDNSEEQSTTANWSPADPDETVSAVSDGSSLPTPPPGFEESKRTTEVEGSGVKKTVLEFTRKKKATKTTSIYAIYENFRNSIAEDKNVLLHWEYRPPDKIVVPGTLKRYGTGYYFIWNDPDGRNQALYTQLCKSLFTQSRGKPSGNATEARLQHQLDVLQAQPPPQPPRP